MIKTFLVAAALSTLSVGAHAQDTSVPARDLPANGGAGARGDHITATGETVPNPGASQSGGTTSLDLGIQKEDNKIQGSICKGC